MQNEGVITFNLEAPGFNLRNRKKLRAFLLSFLKSKRRKPGSLSLTFLTDGELLKMNKEYLNHDFYTDIITFDLSTAHTLIGDVYISVDRVRENAKNLRISFQDELLRVIFHGVLHLTGFNDKTPSSQRQMRKKESELIQKFNVPRET